MGKIMWPSDYPHTDSPWPRSKEYIAEHFAPAPEDVIAKVGGGNAAELYGIQTVFNRKKNRQRRVDINSRPMAWFGTQTE